MNRLQAGDADNAVESLAGSSINESNDTGSHAKSGPVSRPPPPRWSGPVTRISNAPSIVSSSANPTPRTSTRLVDEMSTASSTRGNTTNTSANTAALHHQPHGIPALGPTLSSSLSVAQSVSSPAQQQTLTESPLPPMVQRSLGDRSNEKRKNAALEIEALIKSLQESNNLAVIRNIIVVLSKDFCTSMNSNYRKGGLMGLAATAIGLMHNTPLFLSSLLPPVLHCFDDPESRVRYYACESLYNIAKVSRKSILQYFNQIFEGLTKLYADVDVDVKNGANLLDRLAKDIACEADNFAVEQFMPILQTYIRRTNPYIRQLIVGWITLLDSIPGISMLTYLPEFLDGLFNMLSDSNREIRQAADSALSEFLRELSVSTVVEFGPIIGILGQQCQSKERLNRLTAITWLAELIRHPHAGGDALLPFHGDILGAILWCISDGEKEIRLVAERANGDLLTLVRETRATFDLPPLLDALTKELLEKDDVPTKMAALRWINMLMEKRKTDMNEFTEDILPVLLRTLSDPSDDVVLLDLQVLSRISLAQPPLKTTDSTGEFAAPGEEAQFQMVLNAILNLFANDRQLLETRGSLIIRKLCVLLNARTVYIRLADTLSSYETAGGDEKRVEETLQFISTMVQTLNLILLTASELHDLRASLAHSFRRRTTAELEDDASSAAVFANLFHCWCHNPVATFSLCLLAQAYDLSFALVKRFSQMKDITVGFLMQIDKLVFLLESPIFVHLRLQLLDVQSPYHAPLLKSIYGILMCLPQGDAFRLLNDRLATVCNLRDNLGVSSTTEEVDAPSIVSVRGLDMEKLLQRFDQVTYQQQRARHLSKVSSNEIVVNPPGRATGLFFPKSPGGTPGNAVNLGMTTTGKRHSSEAGVSTRITIHRSLR